MINTKQRAYLKSLASKLDDVVIIGKDGLSNQVIDSVREVLFARELIKIKCLKNSDEEPMDIANKLSEMLSAEIVLVIGSKIVLYKKSSKQGMKHIQLK